MKIRKLTAKNFYSFADLNLDFDNYNGIVKIIGKNLDTGASNGAGKSSIFEAISWGLYGKTIRKSTEDALVNTQKGSECEVSLELEKSNIGTLKITRCKRPTSFNLEVNGINANKANATETQIYLESLLETDYKSFLASVVFGQHSDFSFLDSSPEDKRNIIKNCFNLESLFSKRSSVKQLKSAYAAELKTLQAISNRLQSEKELLEKKIPNNKYKYIELPNLQSILSIEATINNKLSLVKDTKAQLKKNKDKLRKLEEQVSQYDNLSVGHEETKECPVCKSVYTKTVSQSDIDLLKSQCSELVTLISNDETAILSVENEIKEITPAISSSLWAKYNEKNKLIEEAQSHINKLQEVTNELSTHNARISELNGLLEVMKFWEVAFSEKGLIKYIIRNVIDYFNLKCNEYTSLLTSNQFSIQFSDELSERIVNNGVQTRYISLSGGEKRKINLAIMLALQDLSSKISRTDCNLIFFDEVCDNIDDSGIHSVSNLLQTLHEQNKDKVIMVISHNNLLQELLSEAQTIEVIKKKGFSRINDKAVR